jgi:hypothetical protein
MTMMPVKLADALRKQIANVAELHREDLSAGAGEVNLVQERWLANTQLRRGNSRVKLSRAKQFRGYSSVGTASCSQRFFVIL